MIFLVEKLKTHRIGLKHTTAAIHGFTFTQQCEDDIKIRVVQDQLGFIKYLHTQIFYHM